MKTFCFIFVIFALSYLSHAFAHDHASVHGMLVVGKNKVYLSHLPMFHSPHDYQVIVEAELDEPALATYKSLKGLVTLVPEPFVLPDMIANPRPFKAEIFAGHFERGGVMKVQAIVTITKVLLMKKLNPLGIQPQAQEGFIFGEKTDQFMAHMIHARPDFDQVVSISQDGNLKGVVSFSGMDALTQFSTGELLSGGEKLIVKENLYTETGDLSH